MESTTIAEKKARFSMRDFLYKYNILLLFLILFVVSSFLSPTFLSYRNITNLLKQQSPALIATFAMLFAMIVGHIELSIGSNAACAGVILGTLIIKSGWTSIGGLLGAIAICVVVSMLLGCLNGLMVAYLRMPAFIVTLATSFSIRGLANQICSGQSIRSTASSPAYDALVWFSSSDATLLGIPLIFWFVLVVAGILGFILRFTAFGRTLLATGSNATAVELAGIRVRRYTLAAFAIAGLLSGVAGVLISSRAGVFTPEAGLNYEMTAIAGAVIGGASMHGGKGSVLPTILGVFVMAMIENIMNLMSIPPYPQQITKGLIIVAAVMMQVLMSKDESH